MTKHNEAFYAGQSYAMWDRKLGCLKDSVQARALAVDAWQLSCLARNETLPPVSYCNEFVAGYLSLP